MNTVLESTRFLVQDPIFVNINYDAINSLAKKICNDKFELLSGKEPSCIKDDMDSVIDYIILANTINFAFTDFDTKEKYSFINDNVVIQGSSGMMAAIRNALENGYRLLDGDYLKSISADDMHRIFGIIPMFDERLKIFHEIGHVLTNKYAGHFHNVIPADKRLFNNGDGLIERLYTDFPSFDDSVYFDNHFIRFDKRAQLAAAMIYGRFQDQKIFSDIDELTVFADYQVPRTLRYLNILHYEKSLAETIDNQELIQPECLEELELRAATIHAADGLIKKINEKRTPENKINALHIDYYLWRESKKADKPHHLTKTIAY